MDCLYPEIKVKLLGTDGNAFALLGKVKEGLRKGLKKNYSKTNEEVTQITKEFLEEAMSGNYDNLLVTCTKYVFVY